MAKEFVTFNKEGREVDWIDPVNDWQETETEFLVETDYGTHMVSKTPGYTFEVRELMDEGLFEMKRRRNNG